MTEGRRSRAWYGKRDKDGFIHRSWMKNQRFPDHAFNGHPVIGICNTWSELTPGQLMGVAWVDLPSVVVSSGPMMNGNCRGKDIGSGTDVWMFPEAMRTGGMSLQDFMAAESGMSRSKGVYMTMGTASTMASLVATGVVS